MMRKKISQKKKHQQKEALLKQYITVSNFPKAYRKLLCLRFPMDVAEIIELRDMLNQSLERSELLNVTPGFKNFTSTLTDAIELSGVDRQHHADKMVGILSLFRELHYKHNLMSRNREIQLRQLREQNRESNENSVRFGIAALLTAIMGFITFLAVPESGWLLKGITIVSAIATLDFFQSLRIFDGEYKILTDEFNTVLRERVDNMNWEKLTSNLAAILGYRKDQSAFLIHSTADGFNRTSGTESRYH
ncbi:MAG: hypothetical protein IME93_00180 [Proteobacteria bacterium]|nr:hypothetical protein [Pseudomonadota bacterium]